MTFACYFVIKCTKYVVTWLAEATREVLTHLCVENLIREVIRAVSTAQIAELAPTIVVGEAVITTALDVGRRQVSRAFRKAFSLLIYSFD